MSKQQQIEDTLQYFAGWVQLDLNAEFNDENSEAIDQIIAEFDMDRRWPLIDHDMLDALVDAYGKHAGYGVWLTPDE